MNNKGKYSVNFDNLSLWKDTLCKYNNTSIKKPSNNFTIITGSGRCGTTAFTSFMKATGFFHMIIGNYLEDMRGGLEIGDIAVANSLCSKDIIFPQYDHNNLLEGMDLIKKIVEITEISKSPSFFFYNSYEYWKKSAPQEDIQVFLLKRDNQDNVLKSAKKTSNEQDWSYFKNGEEIKKHYKLNVQTLKNLDIPFIELEFPKFITDPVYLFHKLEKYKPLSEQKNFNLNFVKNISSKVFEKSLVTIKK